MRQLSIFAISAIVSTSAFAQHIEGVSPTQTGLSFNTDYLQANGLTQTLKQEQQKAYDALISSGFATSQNPNNNVLSPVIQNYIALKEGKALPFPLTDMGHEYADLQEAIHALNTPNKSSRYVKIGVFLPLSSPLKQVSQNILSAIQMALFDKEISNTLIYVYDIGNTDNQAFKATELAKQDGIHVGIGPIRADKANFVKSAMRGVPLISFTNTASVLQKGLYSIGYLPEDQVSSLADYALASKNQRFSAFIAQNNTAENMLANRFVQHIQSATYNQAEMHPVGSYNAQSSNNKRDIESFINYKNLLSTQAQLVESLSTTEVLTEDEELLFNELQNDNLSSIIPFEALFIPASPKEAKALSHQLAFYDIDANNIQSLGLYPLTNLVGRKGFPMSLSGMYVTAPSQAPLETFNKAFKATTHKNAKSLDVLAYDAMNIIHEISLISGGSFNEKILTRPSGFWGYGGAIRFLDNGANIRKYGIVQLNSNKIKDVIIADGLATHKMYISQHAEQDKKSPFFNQGSKWESGGWFGKPKKKEPKEEEFYIEWF